MDSFTLFIGFVDCILEPYQNGSLNVTVKEEMVGDSAPQNISPSTYDHNQNGQVTGEAYLVIQETEPQK